MLPSRKIRKPLTYKNDGSPYPTVPISFPTLAVR